jgi:Phosphatidylserine decarboxylase
MIYNRDTKEITKEKDSLVLKLLYNNIIGRITLKVLTQKWVNDIGAKYMSSKLSKKRIKKFIKKNKLNMNEYDEIEYSSFNDFFIRKIKDEKRIMSNDTNNFLAPADSRLTVYEINDDTAMNIKNSIYTVEELVRDKSLASKYKGGYCLVYRLCVDDYHRYSFIDNGKIVDGKKIKGVFHTVQAISFKKYKVFKENCREYTVLETENFGVITQIEVGATLVGKICNNNKEEFNRGDEKGYFCFGGSTIVLLVEKDKIVIDKDILEKSAQDIETRVLLFDKIGRKLG